jgi:predicted dehydrogenase
MANLRAGLIGLGAMGRHHARVLHEIGGVDLVAVADAVGDPYGVAGSLPVLPDIEALIAARIDMAVVATPTQYHEEIALKLAEAGIHTMVEKPLAQSVEAGRRMAEAFTGRGLIGAVGHIERFNPAIQQLRQHLAAGDLGEIYQVTTRRQGPLPVRIADVGVTMDLGSHDFDLTAWVVQSPYHSVFAQTAAKTGRGWEDMIVVAGRLVNDVIVSNNVGWLSPMKERITIVTGERGMFIADTLTGDLSFYRNGTSAVEWESVSNLRGVTEGDFIRFAYPKREPLHNEHEAFLAAVTGTELCGHVSMADGLRVLEVAEAALSSAKNNKVVVIDRETWAS